MPTKSAVAFALVFGALVAPMALLADSGERPGPSLDIFVPPSSQKVHNRFRAYRYDRETGAAGVFRDGEANWGAGWTHIVPFGGQTDHVLFYDKLRGRAQVRRVEPDGGLSAPVHSYNDWRKGWDIVVKLRSRCILFYDSKGQASIYAADKKDGSVRDRVFTTKKWTKNWSLIVEVPGGVLFYQRGSVRIYKVRRTCKMTRAVHESGRWRKSWTKILYLRGSKGDLAGVPALLFYDRPAGLARLYRYNAGKGKLGKKLREYKNWPKSWDEIFFKYAADQGTLTFYDREKGGFAYYLLERDATLGRQLE